MSMNNFDRLLDKVQNRKEELSKLRPLNASEIKRLQEDFIIESTYHSNAIEGSTITLDETHMIIKEGITVGGKSIKEHLEIIGYKEAFDYIIQLANNKTDLTERTIQEIHYLVLQDNKEARGLYRNVPVRVGSHIAPQPYLVKPQMERLLEDNKKWLEGNVLIAVSKFHLEFETIHPFIDGNGRTGRLILNLELIKNGYLPINIKYNDMEKYFKSFNHYRKDESKDFSKMVELVANYQLEELDKYISIIKDKEKNLNNETMLGDKKKSSDKTISR